MERRKRLWVLEDDPRTRQIYQELFEECHELAMFVTLSEFKNAVVETVAKPDVVIADLKLPDGSFVDYLTANDVRGSDIPYLVISGVEDMESLRFCFSRGVADYLTKPFSAAELVVKTDRLLNRKSGIRKDFDLDPHTFSVMRQELRSAVLTSKEYQIIHLMRNKDGYCATREDILRHVWPGVSIAPKTLDVHVFNLRKKLAPVNLEIKCEGSDLVRINVRQKSS